MSMKKLPVLALTAILLAAAGCQSQGAGNASDQVKMQRTVGRDQLLQTMDQISAPSMPVNIMEQSDEQIVAWVKQIDDWTHRVLSSPVTGEIDRYAMEEMRKRLSQLYSPEMADRQIDYFYRRNERLGTYQAYSTKAMLGLRSEWGAYEVKKTRGEDGVYRLTVRGTNIQQDVAKSTMLHESAYRPEDGRLRIIEFKTSS